MGGRQAVGGLDGCLESVEWNTGMSQIVFNTFLNHKSSLPWDNKDTPSFTYTVL